MYFKQMLKIVLNHLGASNTLKTVCYVLGGGLNYHQAIHAPCIEGITGGADPDLFCWIVCAPKNGRCPDGLFCECY